MISCYKLLVDDEMPSSVSDESIWAHQLGDTGLLFTSKVTDLYHVPRMSTCE